MQSGFDCAFDFWAKSAYIGPGDTAALVQEH